MKTFEYCEAKPDEATCRTCNQLDITAVRQASNQLGLHPSEVMKGTPLGTDETNT